jgi:hypothetical protein
MDMWDTSAHPERSWPGHARETAADGEKISGLVAYLSSALCDAGNAESRAQGEAWLHTYKDALEKNLGAAVGWATYKVAEATIADQSGVCTDVPYWQATTECWSYATPMVVKDVMTPILGDIWVALTQRWTEQEMCLQYHAEQGGWRPTKFSHCRLEIAGSGSTYGNRVRNENGYKLTKSGQQWKDDGRDYMYWDHKYVGGVFMQAIDRVMNDAILHRGGVFGSKAAGISVTFGTPKNGRLDDHLPVYDPGSEGWGKATALSAWGEMRTPAPERRTLCGETQWRTGVTRIRRRPWTIGWTISA